MQTQKKFNDPNRWRFTGDTYFIMNGQDMREAFTWGEHNKFPKDMLEIAIKNTCKIADDCNFELETGKVYLPKINIDLSKEEAFMRFHEKRKGDLNNDYLRYLCIKGLKEKGLTSQKYKDRLNMELKTIEEMGFCDYFLIYYDICRYCREEGNIAYSYGRGCFEKDSEIYLADGTKKKIQDIKESDVVISHDEKEHEVLTTFEYDCDEKLLDIKTESNKNLKLTKDHKVYGIKKEDFDKGVREPQWYPADELNEGDYLCELDDQEETQS